MFYKEWEVFREQITLGKKPETDFEFSIIPLKEVRESNPNSSYVFEFDLKLFDNYDKQPVKVYKSQRYEHCDVYAGEFFMSK